MNTTLQVAVRKPSRPQPKHSLQAESEFMIEEHLEVQRQIEQCAYGFWRAQGYHAGNTLGNWLKAETLVLGQFIKARMRTSQMKFSTNAKQPPCCHDWDYATATANLQPEINFNDTIKIMTHAMPAMQIRIHKWTGPATSFIQDDADEVKKIFDSFQPAGIFDQDRFVRDGESITSLAVSGLQNHTH